MFQYERMKQRSDYISPKEMIALEEELQALKAAHGMKEKRVWWISLGDMIFSRTSKPVSVNRKKYIKLALSCGWFCGSHRFYAGQKLLGILYLLFFWTGIPAAMTLIDLMIVLPMEADETGMIQL